MKTKTPTGARRNGQVNGTAPDIVIDEEFAASIPAPAHDELVQLKADLLARGCLDALIVWKGHNILLDGHNRIGVCREHDIAFKVKYLEFADRPAAKAWIIRHQLGRRNLSPEGNAYLRGTRYLAEKQAHGGDRSSAEASGKSCHLKTSEQLAEEFGVSERAVCNDGQFAAAVDAIAEHCGQEAKKAILARDTGLSRAAVLALAKKTPAEQKRFLTEYQEKGKPPRRRGGGRKQGSFSVPTEPKSLAAKLWQRLGAGGFSAALAAMTAVLQEHNPENPTATAVPSEAGAD
jgi:hypothetical protein